MIGLMVVARGWGPDRDGVRVEVTVGLLGGLLTVIRSVTRTALSLTMIEGQLIKL